MWSRLTENVSLIITIVVEVKVPSMAATLPEFINCLGIPLPSAGHFSLLIICKFAANSIIQKLSNDVVRHRG